MIPVNKQLDRLVDFVNFEKDHPYKFRFLKAARLFKATLTGDRFYGSFDEKKEARQLVVDYLSDPQCSQALKPHHAKMVHLFDELTRLQGPSFWPAGVGRTILMALAPEPAPQSIPNPSHQSYAFTPLKGLKPPTARELFLIHANAFGHSSDLEGGSTQAMVDYLLGILKHRGVGDWGIGAYREQLVEELSQALIISADFPTFVKEGSEKIKKCFETGKPLLILGGWTAAPFGHALINEVIPDSSSNRFADMRLFNTGAGSQNHPQITDRYKEKGQSYDLWNKIEKKNFGLDFFKALHQQKHWQKVPGTAIPTRYDDKDTYEGLKSILNPASTSMSPIPHLGMTPQHSGVCPWKSLMACLRSRMDLSDYKRFKCDVKIQSLLDFISNSEKPSKEEWRLVQKSFKSLNRGIVELFLDKKIAEPYLKSAFEHLKVVRTWLKKQRNCRYERQFVAPKPGEEAVIKKELFSTSPPLVLGKVDKSSAPSQSYSCTFENFIELFSVADVEAQLTQAITLSEKVWSTGQDSLLHEGLITFVTQLPFDMKFWEKKIQGDRQKAQRVIVLLGRLFHLFAKSSFTCPRAEIPFPERIYAQHKFLYLMEIVSSLASSSKYFENMALYHRNNLSSFSFFSDEKILQEIEMMFSMFPKPLLVPLSAGNESASTVTFFKKDAHNTDVYLDEIIRGEFPEVIKQIEAQVPLFSRCSLEEQAAHIFNSPFLPDWIKALRDASFFSSFLMKFRQSMPAVDRTEDFSFKTQVKNESLLFSLKGSHKLTGKKDNEDEFYWQQFSETTEEIKKLASWRVDRKQVANLAAQDYELPFSNEEFHLIIRLLNDGLTQDLSCLEYFTQFPEKLQIVSYQTLFLLSIFKARHFLKRINDNHKQLARFIQKNYEQFLDLNLIQPALFCLKMGHALSSSCPKVSFFQTAELEIKKLEQRKGLTADQLSLIYAQRLAHLGEKKDLTEDEIEFLLFASIFIEENQPTSKMPVDPYTYHKAQRAVVIHAASLRAFLEKGNPNQAFLNRLLSRLRKEEPKKWRVEKKEGEFPSFVTEGGEHHYYPLHSLFITKGRLAPLPARFLDHPLFKQLFPGIEQALFLSDKLVTFKGPEQQELFAALEGGKLSFEMRFQGPDQNPVWARFIPSFPFLYKDKNGALKSKLGSCYLTHLYQVWQKIEESRTPRLLFAHPMGEKFYPISFKENGGTLTPQIERLEDQSFLDLLPSTPLLAFEDPSYVHVWRDKQGGLVEVELPRFQLSFKPKAGALDQLACTQFPGFVLNSKEPVRELGVFPHYLLLENGNKRKVLIPKQLFRAPAGKQEVLTPRFEMERFLSDAVLKPQEYYVFDYKKDQKLKQRSQEAYLHLSLVLGIAQEYKRAAYYLKKFGEKLTPYRPFEKEIILQLSGLDGITGDQSGDATCLSLQAYLYLLKNQLVTQKGEPLDLYVLKKLYDRYLIQLDNVTIAKISKEDEIFILKTLLNLEQRAVYLARLKHLDHEEGAKQGSAFTSLGVGRIRSIKGIVFPSIQIDETSPNDLLLTRPSKGILGSFRHYYEIARQGNAKDKKQLQAALYFMRLEEGGRYAPMAYFLEAVLEGSKEFPPFCSLKSEKDSVVYSEWIGTVKKIAREQLKKGSKRSEAGPELDWKLPVVPSFREKATPLFPKQPIKKDVSKIIEFLNALVFTNHLEEDEKKKLIADFQEWEKIEAAYFEFNPSDLGKLKEILLQEEKDDLQAMQECGQKIVAIANSGPSEEGRQALFQMKRWGGLRTKITVDNFFETADTVAEEDSEKMNQLVNLFGAFLLYATRQQQRKRSKETCDRLEGLIKKEQMGTAEFRETVQQLAERVLAERTFDSRNIIGVLFEYYSDILIRPVQNTTIEKLMEATNLVLELPPASGKSKVINPLIAFFRNLVGDNFSLLIVPEPLFESNSFDVQKVFKEYFGSSVQTLPFSRHTPCTKENLERILDQIKGMGKRRECLIMTGKSVECLIVKFVELCRDHFEKHRPYESFGPELKLMQQIMSFFREKGFPLIDEADTVLNVFHEVSFSTGKTFNPSPQELELLSLLYQLLYEDPDIKKLARLESDPGYDPKAPILTETLYEDVLKGKLAVAFVKKLKTVTFFSDSLTKKVRQFALQLAEKEPLLLFYLTRNRDHLDEAQAFFDALDEEIQDLVALAGEEICQLLKHTLMLICEQKYGLDHSVGQTNTPSFAIPYAASRVPNTGSQFSLAHKTMNTTFQTFQKKGVDTEVVEKQLKWLQGKAVSESLEKGGSLYRETEAGHSFEKLKGDLNMPLFNYTPENLKDLVAHINASSEAKRFFAASVVLPQLEQYEFKMSCTAHNSQSFFKKKTAFTGTLWNGDSLPHSLVLEYALGANAQTLDQLFRDSFDAFTRVVEGPPEEMLKQLNHLPFAMISDAGGYFRGGTNTEIAHTMAQLKKKETVFYNQQGEQAITDQKKEILFAHSDKKEGERLTFIDEHHTTGADVPQTWDALNIVTIGENMLLRDFIQSVCRNRSLGKGGRTQFVYTPKVEGLIRQKLKLKENDPINLYRLIHFLMINTAEQRGRNNYKGFKDSLNDIFQLVFLLCMMDENVTERERFASFNYLKEYWIKPAFQPSRVLYGKLRKEQKSSLVIDLEKKECESKINLLFRKLPWLGKLGLSLEDSLKQCGLIAQKNQGKLPARLFLPAKDTENEQTVENQLENQAQTHQQTQLEVFESTGKKSVKLGDVSGYIKAVDSFSKAHALIEDPRLDFCPTFPLKSYLEQDFELKAFADAFDGIDIALNVLEWVEGTQQFAFLGDYRTDFQNILIDERATIVTGDQIFHARSKTNYYTLAFGFNKPTQQLTPEQLVKIVKIKFLNGISLYNKEEIAVLRQWFEKEGPKKMQLLYTETILRGYPDKAKRFYAGSPLLKLFTELGK